MTAGKLSDGALMQLWGWALEPFDATVGPRPSPLLPFSFTFHCLAMPFYRCPAKYRGNVWAHKFVGALLDQTVSKLPNPALLNIVCMWDGFPVTQPTVSEDQ